MKLGIISLLEDWPWGGSEVLWHRVAQYALSSRHAVCISHVAHSDLPKPLVELQEEGTRLLARAPRKEPALSLATRILRRLGLQSKPNKWAAFWAENPDHVLINEPSAFVLGRYPELCEALIQNRIPYSLLVQFNQDHRVLYQKHWQQMRKVYGQAHSIFFVSDRNRQVAMRQLAMDLPQAIVVNNPANLSEFTILPYPPPAPYRRMATVARLEANYKGQDLLLEVLAKPHWQKRPWHLSLYGKGPDEAYLKALIDYYGLGSRVSLEGYRSIEEIWKHQELLILPSIAEGTPLSLMEAMWCGRAAVVTDVAGNAEWIIDGKTGFVAPAPTVQMISETLERAWQAQEQWEEMGGACYEYMQQHYDSAPEKRILRQITEEPELDSV